MDYEFVSVQNTFICYGRSKLVQTFELIYALQSEINTSQFARVLDSGACSSHGEKPQNKTT